MIVREVDANGLLCPMSLASMGTMYCSASQCMAWRWHSMAPWKRSQVCDDRSATEEPPRPDNLPPDWTFEPYAPEDDSPAQWQESDEEQKARRTGYCGMAPLHK